MRNIAFAGLAPDIPQSWNRYAYALNNPLRYVDPTGLEAVQGFSGGGCFDYDISDNEGGSYYAGTDCLRGFTDPDDSGGGGGAGGGGQAVQPPAKTPPAPPAPKPPSVWQKLFNLLPKFVSCPPGPVVGVGNQLGANIVGGVEIGLFTGHFEHDAGTFVLSGILSATLGTPQVYASAGFGLDQLQGSPTDFDLTVGAGELGRAVISSGITSDFSFSGAAVGGGALLAATPVQAMLATPIVSWALCFQP